MYHIPDHPDIECAMRTGYPRSYWRNNDDDGYDEDFEYESRREEAMFDDLD